mgnify:CR=1 FL=1
MWDSFWDYLWSAVVIFAFIAYLMILFNILADLFGRDHKTSGWVKAIWVVFLIAVPYLTALVYLIVRDQALQAKQQADEYIRDAAGRSPAQEIADAKALLEAGTITAAEFDSLKAKALS